MLEKTEGAINRDVQSTVMDNWLLSLRSSYDRFYLIMNANVHTIIYDCLRLRMKSL
jgi:hypothetical protein